MSRDRSIVCAFRFPCRGFFCPAIWHLSQDQLFGEKVVYLRINQRDTTFSPRRGVCVTRGATGCTVCMYVYTSTPRRVARKGILAKKWFIFENEPALFEDVSSRQSRLTLITYLLMAAMKKQDKAWRQNRQTAG